MRWIIKFIFQRLRCRHAELRFVRNLYGYEINLSGGKRSVWECRACEKYMYHTVLVDRPSAARLSAARRAPT